MMGGRRGAGNLEDPDEIVDGAGFVGIAPADVVQGGFDGLAGAGIDVIDHQGVERYAFVHFV